MRDTLLVAGAPTELGNVVPHWHAVLSRGGPCRGHAAAGKQVCVDCTYNEVQDLQVLSTTDSNAQLHPSMTDAHRRNHAGHVHIEIVAAHPMLKSLCKGGKLEVQVEFGLLEQHKLMASGEVSI